MAKLLFKLNSVPDDEANEIRALLESANIDFYETSPGNWGLSFAAIWLNQEQQFEEAKQLIDKYQFERYMRVRQELAELKEANQNITYWLAFKRSPFKIIAVMIFVCAIFYFSVIPFFPA
ncbi:DUF6164 family protein [Aliikangiella sp. IMCC44359]|uniref:DUF6164 family protein n=1 Tax=Aliikangiella sp. IMCC44359 TaxID=3459125 RepID=UPI00403AF504